MTSHVLSDSKYLNLSKDYHLTSAKYAASYTEPRENMTLISAISVKEKMNGVILEGMLVRVITRFTWVVMNVNQVMARFIQGFRNLNERDSLRQGKSTGVIPLFQVLRIGWLCVL